MAYVGSISRRARVTGISRVLTDFKFGRARRGGNVSCDKDSFYSFSTAIAVRLPSGIILINGDVFSHTSSSHQRALRQFFPSSPTVSFSALTAYLSSQRLLSRRTFLIEEALTTGSLRLLDYTLDSHLYSANTPINDRPYRGEEKYGDAPSSLEGWHVSRDKSYERPDGTRAVSGEEIEYWTAHRPGSALFQFQPKPTAGPNAPYSLKFLTGEQYNASLPDDEKSYLSAPIDSLVALRTYTDDTGEHQDGRAQADLWLHDDEGKHKYRLARGEPFSLSQWESIASDRLGFPAINNTADPAPLTILVGMDEGSYFASSLPGSPKTVPAAYASFMPALVRRAVDGGATVPRQGEWYFVPVDSVEVPQPRPVTVPSFIDGPACNCPDARTLPQLDHYMQAVGYRVLKNAALPRELAGNPHTCTRIYVPKAVRLSATGRFLADKFPSVPIFVIGRVKHDDHRTVTLYPLLHRAVRNRSLANRNSEGWVD